MNHKFYLRLLSRTEPLYLILGQGLQPIDDDSSSSEEIPEKIEEGDYGPVNCSNFVYFR
jgi:hypothetical protein